MSWMLLAVMAVLAVVVVAAASSGTAYSQEPGLATFQETAQIIIDKRTSQSVTASVTLQSTDIGEIIIPEELARQLAGDPLIDAVVLTNHDPCIAGVSDQSCILINVARDPESDGIASIRDSTRAVGDAYIDAFNQLFDTGAAFHSIYIHTDDAANRILGTSGVISGRGTVSAVYTMPMEETHSMYERISTMLVSEEIRNGQGFYGIARDLSSHENAKVSFSIIPLDSNLLFQLRLSTVYPGEEFPEKISPMDYLQTGEITRSDYLTSGGFYPLNSLVQVVVLSDGDDDDAAVSDVMGSVTPTRLIDGQQIPTDITINGWVFDPSEGDTIQGKYIFGSRTSIGHDELAFSLGAGQGMTPDQDLPTAEPPEDPDALSYGLIAAAAGGIAAAAAAGIAVFYIRRRRK